MDLSHVAVHQLISGMSGKGKSTFARKLAIAHRARWKFGFESWKREFSAPAPNGLSWARCVDEPGLRRAVMEGRHSAFYSAPLFPGDRIAGFNFWATWIANVGKQLPGGKLIIVEEIEATTEHRNSKLCPAFAEILDELRGAKFDVIMVAQRVSTVNELVRAQTTDIITFQHVDPNQLKWLEAEQFNRSAVEVLKRGEYIWRQRETATERTNARSKANGNHSKDNRRVG
jgi:hypothetical protein